MKLLRLKLLSQFRGLQEGFEIEFKSSNLNGKSLTPVCFIGQNGCGKSNVMEVLSEIFYELELMHLNYTIDDDENDNKQLRGYGYVLEYLIKSDSEISTDDNSGVGENYQKIKVEKKVGLAPVFYKLIKTGEYMRISDRNKRKKLLPLKIIGYSSGMNELISSPFTKMKLHYFNEYKKNIENEYKSDIERSRMFYMDYEVNTLILVSNYLIHNKSKINVINEILNIDNLHSFRIVINLEGTDIDETYKINEIDTLGSIIEKLKTCATCYYEDSHKYLSKDVGNLKLVEEKDSNNRNKIILDFLINEATIEAFKYYFVSASELFSILYILQSLNLDKIPSYQRTKILRHKSASTLLGLIPKTTDDDLVFKIENVFLSKKGVNNPIHYKKFSDGEHQLMQTIGAILLIDDSGTLFLMDEPETHFNPQWRSKFVNILNKITVEEMLGRKQELIITTHSPFILSDCYTDNVYKFVRNQSSVEVRKPDIQTYGTSFSILYKEIFDKNNTVSDLVANSIEKLKNESIETCEDIERIEESALELGESTEKFFLLGYINRCKRQIDSKDDEK